MKRRPLEPRPHDRFHARPSTTESGWTIMQQIAGETHLRLFARARDEEAAKLILKALKALDAGDIVKALAAPGGAR